ncbi:MAG: hypothetical protein KF810_16935 [Rhizobiaceae bacterium]|nr:hypothetical protein [Rhizobiaceae bacterium]
MFIDSYRPDGITTYRPAPVRSEFRKIEALAMRIFNITRDELHAVRSKRRQTLARQFVMYWTRRRTKLSLTQIGRLMGGRDPTTIKRGRISYVEKRAKMGRSLRKAP